MTKGVSAINRPATRALTFLLAAISSRTADGDLPQSFAAEKPGAHMRMHHDMARPMTGNADRYFFPQ